MNQNEHRTQQTTLGGGAKTRVGHTRKDSRTTVHIGRVCRPDETKHMNNTPVGEPGWIGNPYPKADYGRERCIELFREDFEERLGEDEEFRDAVRQLHGEILGCYCQRIADGSPACHGDVVAEWADRLAEDVKE